MIRRRRRSSRGIFKGQPGLQFVTIRTKQRSGADALVLMTEWKLYWAPDFDRLRQSMNQAVIIDGRNIWSPQVVRRRGISLSRNWPSLMAMNRKALITGIITGPGRMELTWPSFCWVRVMKCMASSDALR